MRRSQKETELVESVITLIKEFNSSGTECLELESRLKAQYILNAADFNNDKVDQLQGEFDAVHETHFVSFKKLLEAASYLHAFRERQDDMKSLLESQKGALVDLVRDELESGRTLSRDK